MSGPKQTRAEALRHFLEAMDEWGCEDNSERAEQIIAFIDGGCDLSAWKEGRPYLTVIDGGRHG